MMEITDSARCGTAKGERDAGGSALQHWSIWRRTRSVEMRSRSSRRGTLRLGRR